MACAKSPVMDYPTLKILHSTGLALSLMGLSGILAMEMTGEAPFSTDEPF
jgi:hypothetical protein